MTVIFYDIDGTLLTPHAEKPRRSVITSLKFFASLGNTIGVWSGGGAEYAARRLGEIDGVLMKENGEPIAPLIKYVCGKTKETAELYRPDICFDDADVKLATVNIRV